ncbi:MAG TPA: HK97 family phage prohead protease [Streptosporangiaceae bacterium]
MPWKAMPGHGCSGATPWAVVKTITGEKVSCHATKAKAEAQVKLLYSKEPSMASASTDCGCGGREHQDGTRAVDNSAWDGPAAMSSCASSSTPASCYRSICAGRKSGDPALQSSWALPHHKTSGGPPNAAGVRNSLSRLPQTQGLTNAPEARRHLEAHLASINAGSSSASAEPPRDSLFRAFRPGYELREDTAGGMPTLVLRWSVFNDWTEINSIFEGRFLERFDPASMNRTITEERDGMRVLFQHGRDPQIGDKPLGPIDQIEAKRDGAWSYVPLFDTQYNRELLPGLRAGVYGSSMRFSVREETWNKKPGRSKHNPEGLPERTVLDASVPEHGPVTFPAYKNATAGVRSVTDEFLGLALGQIDPERLAEFYHDFTGRGDQRMAPGGDHADLSGHDEAAIQEALHARDRAWRLRRTLHVH